jgi:hypothetical protein
MGAHRESSQAMLIGSHLGSPHPKRFRKQNLVGVFDLRNFDIGALHLAASGMVCGWDAQEIRT